MLTVMKTIKSKTDNFKKGSRLVRTEYWTAMTSILCRYTRMFI